jgi:hypothetical protein
VHPKHFWSGFNTLRGAGVWELVLAVVSHFKGVFEVETGWSQTQPMSQQQQSEMESS